MKVSEPCAASCQIPNSFEEPWDFLRVSLVLAQADKGFVSGSIPLTGTEGGMALRVGAEESPLLLLLVIFSRDHRMSHQRIKAQTQHGVPPAPQLEKGSSRARTDGYGRDPEQLSSHKHVASGVCCCFLLLL